MARSFLSRSKRFLSRLTGSSSSNRNSRRSSTSITKSDNDDDTVTTSIVHSSPYESVTITELLHQISTITTKTTTTTKTITKDDEEQQQQQILVELLYEIANRCWEFPTLRPAFYQAGCLNVVVATLQKFATNAELQVAGCLVLQNMTGSSTMDAIIIQACYNIGAVRLIVEALQTHKNVAAVQNRGCAALCNLVYRSASNGTLLVNELNILDIIVTAMQTFQDNVSVQKHGCWALYNLSAFDPRFDFDTKIRAAGGEVVLQKALATHHKSSNKKYTDAVEQKDHKALLEYGPRVLARLAGTSSV